MTGVFNTATDSNGTAVQYDIVFSQTDAKAAA